tara:strand:+ start:4110 stop:4961 length:852 start_codon:yes stop_codon:yes gene_type:complete
MATRTWEGNTSSDWGTSSNWVENSVPVSTDDVYIVSGIVSIDGDDQSAVTLGSLTVGQKYTGSIGSSGVKLEISATNFDYSGQGTSAYIEGTFTNLTVQNTSADSAALNLSGDSDTITTLRILGGRGGINIASSCNIVTTIEQIGADSVTTNIADNTTIGGSCSLIMDSGKLELYQAIPTITIFGGELEAVLDSGTVTTLDQYGGRVRWNPTASCTITSLNIYSGLFDSRDSTAPAFTVTNTLLHEGGTIDERSGLENAIWTNALAMEGGEVRYDSGRQVTIS